MKNIIKRTYPLERIWKCLDPFLFCAYHNDQYPSANDEFGPSTGVKGRMIGSDYENRDGWNMYHGEKVPGFPQHPHRGFETVTLVRKGLLDHADSLGFAARFGNGDTQWITAGEGLCHSEMFPLLKKNEPNPLELFQIWLNLPSNQKLSPPEFKIFWQEETPLLKITDDEGLTSEVLLISGELSGSHAPIPPAHSWASDPSNEVCILTGKIPREGKLNLPEASKGINRMVYFFNGRSLRINGEEIQVNTAAELEPDQIIIKNGEAPSEFLFLQGKPINEPVFQHGPFVMNTREEIIRAIEDYQRTGFGGWPWKDSAPVHGTKKRFALYPDGNEEKRG